MFQDETPLRRGNITPPVFISPENTSRTVAVSDEIFLRFKTVQFLLYDYVSQYNYHRKLSNQFP